MTEFDLLLQDARKRYVEVKLTFDMRDDAAVTMFGHELTSDMIEWSKAARKLLRHVFDHGITIYVAVNLAGDTMTHTSEDAARKWLEDFPGEGANMPRIQPSQVWFK